MEMREKVLLRSMQTWCQWYHKIIYTKANKIMKDYKYL